MASLEMCRAANRAIELGGNIGDAIDAALRKQIDRVYDGEKSVTLPMMDVDRDDLLAYFDVEPE